MAEATRQEMSSDFRSVEITPTVRVVETDREWIIQTAVTKRTRRFPTQPTGEWVDRAYITGWAILNMELKRLLGAGKMGLRGHVGPDVMDWLNRLPGRHPSRGPTVLDMLEASTSGSEHGETFHDHLPLIVKHGPLTYRNDRNARFDP
ncbi:hypothetical protein [Mesorhizobium sp.]|uniref:hypothetical protein n=1 Tax=Mesorhizobium sp. TaxID=1871066 RepID=UPI000FEA70C6|nr:hypothetical protein [Mesorhizobium sp.]RWC31561.1 MAG: hypothetical protein EOS27_10340 [Mesorhizobium sp.]TIX27832.1 MAG: hypothetical protein E5V35_04840 [Mesorhizobium sp.]